MNINLRKIFIVSLLVTTLGMVTYAVYDSVWLGGDTAQNVKKQQRGLILLPEMTTLPGQTLESEIEQRENILSVIELGEESKEYQAESEMYLKPNRIVVENSVVVYEAVVPDPDNYSQENYPKIIDLLIEFGEPEAVYEGSVDLGPFVRTYVFAGRGFAFVGRPATDEVLQMQFFVPMSLDEYVHKHAANFVTPENFEHKGP